MSRTYAELAVHSEHPFMVRVFTGEPPLRHCNSTPTLDEALDFAMGAEHAELLAVDEPIPGVAVETKLADILCGEWFICDPTKELTMAKVKKIEKNGTKGSRAVLDDLIGDPVPSKKSKQLKAKAAKAGNAKKERSGGSRAAFDTDQRIKVLKKYDRNLREGTNLALSLGVLKSGMTIADWNKARAKAGVENTGFGYLHMLVEDGYVKVV